MRHNFVASYNWKLPLGWSRSGGRTGWTEGWSISGITRFSTGLPVTLFNNNDTSLLGTHSERHQQQWRRHARLTRPAISQSIPIRETAGRPSIPSLFSLPALGQIGTAARRFFYGPGIANFDLALHKSVQLAESRSLELRVEAFNVFNHAQFYGPAAVNGNISSANFGQVVSAAAPRLVQLAAKLYF